MASRLSRRPRLIILGLILVVVAAGWLLFGKSDPIRELEHPEYLSFSGNYVFSVPKEYSVDEQSVEGIQIVYKGNIVGKTIDQVYVDNNISLQPITFLKDKKSYAFKKYVNETFVPDAKKVLAPDVSTEFAKVDDWDVARVTVKKDGQPHRFVYLKNGQHPVSIVSKEETEAFKKIASSVTDVEKTDLKSELASLKEVAQKTAQLIRDKNAKELYKQAAQDLRSNNTEDQLNKLLAAEEVFSQGSVTINGGSFSGGEFGAAINFAPLNKDFKPASGALYFKKVDGQWKLKGMQLPNPLEYRVQQ